VDTFLENVLSQHYILAYGDHMDVLNDICRILGVEMVFAQTVNGTGGNGQARLETDLLRGHRKQKKSHLWSRVTGCHNECYVRRLAFQFVVS